MLAICTFIVSSCMLVNLLVIRPAINDSQNNAIRDIDISRQSYIILVRHAGTARIPNGSTMLHEGDEVFVFSREKASKEKQNQVVS